MNRPPAVAFVRYLTGAAVALVLVALLLVLGLAIYRGISLNSPQAVGLLAGVGTLVAVLANLLGTNQVASAVQSVHAEVSDVHEKVNGHLEQHIGHTDAEVKRLVDQRLSEIGGASTAPPEGAS